MRGPEGPSPPQASNRIDCVRCQNQTLGPGPDCGILGHKCPYSALGPKMHYRCIYLDGYSLNRKSRPGKISWVIPQGTPSLITQPSDTDTTNTRQTKTGPKTTPKATKQTNQPGQPAAPIKPGTRHPNPEQPRDPQRLPRPTYQAATMSPAPWAARDWKAKKSWADTPPARMPTAACTTLPP